MSRVKFLRKALFQDFRINKIVRFAPEHASTHGRIMDMCVFDVKVKWKNKVSTVRLTAWGLLARQLYRGDFSNIELEMYADPNVCLRNTPIGNGKYHKTTKIGFSVYSIKAVNVDDYRMG